MESEVQNYEKEIKMLNILQKQYTFEMIEFAKQNQAI